MTFLVDVLERALLLLVLCPVQSITNRKFNEFELQRRPVIGILAQETSGKLAKFGKSYIAASYVKYIESAGARVVPILFDNQHRTNLTDSELEKVFHSINGVLFPGGGVSLTESGYGKNGKAFYDLSLKAFDESDIFPVWGTCLGFELLSTITAGLNTNVLTSCDAENLVIPLDFSEGYAASRIFGTAPDNVIKFLSGLNVTANFHRFCVLTDTFKQSKNMTTFYKLLSTNKDRAGKEYVSMMEGHEYPIFASQWHPEKNPFEWVSWEVTSHSFEAVLVAQYMANFFVEQSRKSGHRFASTEEEEEALIYNYSPVHTAKDSSFEQCYFF